MSNYITFPYFLRYFSVAFITILPLLVNFIELETKLIKIYLSLRSSFYINNFSFYLIFLLSLYIDLSSISISSCYKEFEIEKFNSIFLA